MLTDRVFADTVYRNNQGWGGECLFSLVVGDGKSGGFDGFAVCSVAEAAADCLLRSR